MTEEAIRDLTALEQGIVDAIKRVNRRLDEEEAARQLVEIMDVVNTTPELGKLTAKMAVDSRVALAPKVQLALLTLNTVLWGPARFWSRLITSPAGWFVGPTAFFNDVVGALYGLFRLAQLFAETEREVFDDLWDGDPDELNRVLDAIADFNTWALDNKVDKVFNLLSWIP